MGCKRQVLVSRLLLAVMLCVLCFDGGRLSERAVQREGRQHLIDMSIEELMDLRVTCNFDKGAQQLIDSIPKSKS
jgi:hypothetical protein